MSKDITEEIYKSYPLIYPPRWLCGIPESQLSYAAKILYAFMRTRADSKEITRIYNENFSAEIGMSFTTLKKYLKELIKQKLIFLWSEPDNGYKFLKHRWIEQEYD